MARAGGAETLTDALSEWSSRLWRPDPRLADGPPPVYYIDGHRKAVHSDKLIPRGLVSRYGKVLGCRALTLLHDKHGHPLLALTHRGDTHLTVALPEIVERYERATGQQSLKRMVVDREGMAAGLLARLGKDGRDAVTVLRSNQYEGLESFTDVGQFVPLSWDRQGEVTREVAPARCSVRLPDDIDGRLDLQVALVRDLRRLVPCPRAQDHQRSAHDAYSGCPSWFADDWVATATAAVPTEPALVPIVTTASEVDPSELAGTYRKRWPIQENVIRDWLLPLGLDTNHGYAKAPVSNSEVEKRRAALERRLTNAKRWGERARLSSLRASKTSDRRWKLAKVRSSEAYAGLNQELAELEAKGASEREYRTRKRQLVAAVEAEMEGHWQSYYRAFDTCNREYAKWQRYCQEQRELLRELEDLKSGERQMYELDDRKDQLMSVLKVALANLVMWVRDHYFPPDYACATWQRLVPFFRLPGEVVRDRGALSVELRVFNNRALNRNLASICATVGESRPRLPGGRQLLLAVPGSHITVCAARERRVA